MGPGFAFIWIWFLLYHKVKCKIKWQIKYKAKRTAFLSRKVKPWQAWKCVRVYIQCCLSILGVEILGGRIIDDRVVKKHCRCVRRNSVP